MHSSGFPRSPPIISANFACANDKRCVKILFLDNLYMCMHVNLEKLTLDQLLNEDVAPDKERSSPLIHGRFNREL